MMRGMGNMQGMMKQMKKLQQNMQEDQKNLNESEFVGKAPEDMVVATFTGDHRLKDISIKEEAVDPDDVDMLQDFVVAAINDAMAQIDDATQKTMGKYSRLAGM